MYKYLKFLTVLCMFMFSINMVHPQEKKLNVIVIGAHPDDADGTAGGTAIKFAQLGHNVLFVSLTNGDAGHQSEGGGALAKRRRAEAQEAAKRFGVSYKVLDYHDGELQPTLDARLAVIRLIRGWNADIVIGPRTNDYHPDHRNTAILVQDAAYLVIVPNVAPDTPPLKKNPLFLYAQDEFQKPNPFRPDIAVNISDVFEQKVYAMAAHESQYFEWLPWTESQTVPTGKSERMKWFYANRKRPITDLVQKSLEKWYGKERAAKFTDAEAFEICEYGKQPTDKEIQELFPMLNKK